MNNKTVIKIAKQFGKTSVVPILETAKLTSNEITFSDLDTEIVLPFNSGITICVPTNNLVTVLETFHEPAFKLETKEVIREKSGETVITYEHTVFMSEGKQTIKVKGDDINQFPVSKQATELLTGVIFANMMPVLLEAVAFVGTDDLMPALTCVELSDHIAATDAHRLMYVPIEKPFLQPVLIRKKAIKLMELAGGEWFVLTDSKTKMVTLQNGEGVRITFRAMDHRFPQWRLVLPEVDSKTSVATLQTKEVRQAIKTGAKFGNRTTHMGVITLNGKATYRTWDINFQTEYDTEIPVEYKDEIEIGFNANYLDGILEKCGKTAKMNYFTPTKAALFNDRYLLMPMPMLIKD